MLPALRFPFKDNTPYYTFHQKRIIQEMGASKMNIIIKQSRYGMDLDYQPGYDDGEKKY